MFARAALARRGPIALAIARNTVRYAATQAPPKAAPAPPTVFVEGGTARVKLPLAKDSLLFSLPAASTVGHLVKSIKEEGHAKDVVVRSADGTRVAQSTAIGDLLRSGDFSVSVDSASIAVKTSPEAKRLATEASDVERIRNTVREMHASMSSSDTVESLESKLEVLKTEIAPMKEIRDKIEDNSHARADRAMLFGIGLMGVQFGVLARLTWWEYSWDIIEPVTYFVTYGTAILAAGYFFVTKRDFEYSGEKERRANAAFAKLARSKNLDVDRYNSLHDAIAQVESDIARIKRREEITRAVAKEVEKVQRA